MIECNACKYLECNISKNYLGEVLYGGSSFSCKKGYFIISVYPFQPYECKNNLPPKNPFSEIEFKKISEDEIIEMDTSIKISNNIKQPKWR